MDVLRYPCEDLRSSAGLSAALFSSVYQWKDNSGSASRAIACAEQATRIYKRKGSVSGVCDVSLEKESRTVKRAPS